MPLPSRNGCVFCRIIAHDPEGQIERRLHRCVLITPLNPVTPGHKLVIPVTHVENATESPAIAGLVMEQAAQYADDWEVGPCNYITSAGRAATQTIEHLHLHIVPRWADDGLSLPWSVPA